MLATGQTPPFWVLIVTPAQGAGALPEMLTQFGYRVTALVSSAAEALAMLEEKAVNVVLLDVSPADEPNGVSLLDWLRTHSIPFVWMASNKDRNPVDELVAQPSPTLTRPFRAQQVWATLEIIRCRHVNKDILKREREKTLLLSLSEDMATIRDRNDLWRAMMEKAKLLLPFDESPQLFVLSPDGQSMRALLNDPSQEAAQTSEYQAHMSSWFPIGHTPFEEALGAVAPKIFDYNYFAGRYPHYWGTRIWQQVGIEEMLTVQLNYGGKAIGIFNVLSRRANTFATTGLSLFKAIADQVAVAVDFLLAIEEILERVRVKTHFL